MHDLLTDDLPGADLITRGLADLEAGNAFTVEALLVAAGRPRLLRLGFDLPYEFPDMPEHALYFALAERHGNEAHSKYNALIRRFVSFAQALESLVPAPRQGTQIPATART